MELKALITIYHDGKKIKTGEKLDIKDDEAKNLIEKGFASVFENKTEVKTETKDNKKTKNAV